MAKKKPYQRAERQRQAQRLAEQEQRRRQRIVVIAAVVSVALVIGVVAALSLAGGDNSSASNPTPTASTPTTPAAPETPASIPTAIAPAPVRPTPLASEVSCTYKKSAEPASKKVDAPKNGKVSAKGKDTVSLATSVGNLKLTLDRALAPCTVNSFLSLVGQKYFDNTTCHRMTTGQGLQVLQCGDPSGTGSGGPGYSFADEVFPTLKYGRGTLAMANSGPNTNGSQFFIVYGDASVLNPAYTAFGTVDAASLAVIDKVARKGVQSSTPGSGDGKPVTPVTIKTATKS